MRRWWCCLFEIPWGREFAFEAPRAGREKGARSMSRARTLRTVSITALDTAADSAHA